MDAEGGAEENEWILAMHLAPIVAAGETFDWVHPHVNDETAYHVLEYCAGLEMVDDPDAVSITSGLDACYPALPHAANRRVCKHCGKPGCSPNICPVFRKELKDGTLKQRGFRNRATSRQPTAIKMAQAVRNARDIRRRVIRTKNTTGRQSLGTNRRWSPPNSRVPIKRPVTRNRVVDRVIGKARNIAACILASIESEEFAQAVTSSPEQAHKYEPTSVYVSLDEEYGSAAPPTEKRIQEI